MNTIRPRCPQKACMCGRMAHARLSRARVGDMVDCAATQPAGRPDGLDHDRTFLCRNTGPAECLMVRHGLAKKGRVSVAIENSLSRQGIAASYRDNEHGAATRVGHDRSEQTKPSELDHAHGQRPAHSVTRTRQGHCVCDQGSSHGQVRQGDYRDRPPMLLCCNRVDQ